MNRKQARFVVEYTLDHNASQAAIRAGYTERSSRTTGSRLLADPDIARAIQEREDHIADALGLTKEYLLNAMEAAAKAASDAGQHTAAVKARETLMKHRGMLIEKSHLELSGGIHVTLNGVPAEDL